MSNIKFTPLFRLLSVVLCIVMTLSSVSFGVYAERDFQAEIDALESKIDANNAKKEDKQKSADELNEEIDTLQEQIDVYNAQISELNSQISGYDAVINQHEAEIAKLDESINETGVQIDKLNAQIANTQEVLAERMRASYMAGETSILEILLDSSDFESFLTRLELLSAVAKRDNELISAYNSQIDESNKLVDQLNTQKQEQVDKQAAVEAERAKIVDSRAQIQSARNSISSQQAKLEKKVDSYNSILSNLDQSSAQYRAQMEKIKKEQAEYDAIKQGGMDNGSGSLNTGGGKSEIGNYPVSSKGMIAPLQYSNVYVSQHYGHNGHKGVDICTRGTGSTMGKEIRAAADGVVYSAEFHKSWGNNVYINHGNGVYTRYAHCSKMIVSAGDQVKQGQVIAYVGNTGNSFGPHLHFEVWVNGTRTNPEEWIPAMANK